MTTTIDKFERATGVATSIKSIDLGAKTYQTPSRLERLMTGYIDKMAGFNGARWGGDGMDEFEIMGRQLLVATPRGATVEQQAVLASMADYAEQHGVKLIVEVMR